MTARTHVRITPRHRRFVDATLATLLATGVLWLLLEPGDSAEAMSVAARGAWRADVALHTLAGLAGLVALGTLWLVHIRRAWRSRRNRVAGTATLALFVALAVTGWALGYASLGMPHEAIARMHWIGGFVAAAVYLVHRWRGTRTRDP